MQEDNKPGIRFVADKKAATNVLFATPAYGGLVYITYVDALVSTIDVLRQKNIGWSVAMMGNESLITRGRNNMVAQFMKGNWSHLFFIDADIGWKPEHVLWVLDADEDIVCGAYPKKSISWDMVQDAWKRGVKDPSVFASPVVVNQTNFVKEGDFVPVKKNLIEVLDAGTGFMCIKRHVIEKMILAYPEHMYVDDGPKEDGKERGNVPMLFNADIWDDHIDGKPAKRYLSEDYAFCRMWQKIGGTIYVHLGVSLTHTGTHQFRGSPLQFNSDVNGRSFRAIEAELPDTKAILESGYPSAASYSKGTPSKILDKLAGVGAFAAWASKRWPGVFVLCVEDRDLHRSILEENIRNLGLNARVASQEDLDQEFDLVVP